MGVFGYDTAFDGESGCLEKICGVQQTPPVRRRKVALLK